MTIATFEINEVAKLKLITNAHHIDNFCDVAIIYSDNDNEIVLYDDVLTEALVPFKNILEKAIMNELKLIEKVNKYPSVGFAANIFMHEISDDTDDGSSEDPTSNYWLWDSKTTQTWLYNTQDSDIELEISPIYKWHFLEPEENDDHEEFEDFVSNYTSIKFRLENKQVINWINEVNRLHEKYIKSYIFGNNNQSSQ